MNNSGNERDYRLNLWAKFYKIYLNKKKVETACKNNHVKGYTQLRYQDKVNLLK